MQCPGLVYPPAVAPVIAKEIGPLIVQDDTAQPSSASSPDPRRGSSMESEPEVASLTAIPMAHTHDDPMAAVLASRIMLNIFHTAITVASDDIDSTTDAGSPDEGHVSMYAGPCAPHVGRMRKSHRIGSMVHMGRRHG